MNTPLHILLVEDSDDDAQLVIRQLRKGGCVFETVRATNREEYLTELSNPGLDLILADYALPAFDGMSALALAQQARPEVPFIIVSGVLGEERAVETLKAGATDYVLKERLARLASAVERALEEAEERRKRREAEAWLRERTDELERANAELAAHRARLRKLSRRLVEVQEAERAAMSRNLHDTAAQGMTAVLMGLSRFSRLPGLPPEALAQVANVRASAEQVATDLHRLAVNLRPSNLDRYGLVGAVEQYLTALPLESELRVQLQVEAPEDERLPADIEIALYRIVQEAVTNVVRHAQAESATVVLRREAGWMVAVIGDTGVGCDVEEALRGGRLGLVGMRERAEMAGGQLVIESRPGAGMQVTARLPVNREAV